MAQAAASGFELEQSNDDENEGAVVDEVHKKLSINSTSHNSTESIEPTESRTTSNPASDQDDLANHAGGISSLKHRRSSQSPTSADHNVKPPVEQTQVIKHKVNLRGHTVILKPQAVDATFMSIDANNNQHHKLINQQQNVSQAKISMEVNGDNSYPVATINLSLCIPVLLSCVLLILLFYFVLKYCKKLNELAKEKQKQNSKLIDSNTFQGVKIFKSRSSRDSPLVKRQLSICTETESSANGDNNYVKQELNNNQKSTVIDSCNKISQKSTTNKAKQSSSSKKSLSKPELNYGLKYDFNKSILFVTIYRARNLPGLDLCGSSDPYVKVNLLPEEYKSANYKTKIHRRTLNPEFNETFEFQVAFGELNHRTLVLSCYDYDRFSKHDEIGQISIPIGAIDLSQTHEQWSELLKTSDSANGNLGDICLSLRYGQTTGRLTVVVLEARQLKKMDLAGLSDPYVKLVLVDSLGTRIKKKKTSIKKCTLNPHYNESFSFEIPFEQVQKVRLIVTVIDYDRIGTSEPIGKIVLACEKASGDQESRHWMDMLASPRRPIAQWHCLKELDRKTITNGPPTN